MQEKIQALGLEGSLIQLSDFFMMEGSLIQLSNLFMMLESAKIRFCGIRFTNPQFSGPHLLLLFFVFLPLKAGSAHHNRYRQSPAGILQDWL